MRKSDSSLGSYLRAMRENNNFSQIEVARHLGYRSAQSVSDWERNQGSPVPISALKALIKLYKISSSKVFEMLLEHQTKILERKISEEFYGRPSGRESRKG